MKSNIGDFGQKYTVYPIAFLYPVYPIVIKDVNYTKNRLLFVCVFILCFRYNGFHTIIEIIP